jgi:multidrug resistance efflux pump
MMMKKTRLFNIFRPGRIHPQILPLVVWLVALAGVAVLFLRSSVQFEVVGLTQGEISQVCAPVDGRLKAVYVQLYDNVAKGQVVAALDDELVAAKIDTIAAAAEHLRAQLAPTQQQLLTDAASRELNRTEEQRRFAVDIERARLNILGLKVQIATDRVTFENYAVELKIATDLLAKNAIAPYELEKTKILYDATAKKIQETETQLAQAEEQLKEVQRRQDTLASQTPQNPSVDAALEPIRKEVAVQEKLMQELEVQRKGLVITAPIDGVVVQILARANEAATQRAGEGVLHRPGEVVIAGQPILVIAQGKPKEIIGYEREGQIGQIKAGAKVELVKKSLPPQIGRSEVTFVGPVVEQLPARLWPNPNLPQWGLPFVIKVPEGMELTAGEMVGIRRL